MTSIRSSRPTARKAAKTTAKRGGAASAKKASGTPATKKARAGLRGTARISSIARAELNGILDRIHHNIDEAEALLAD